MSHPFWAFRGVSKVGEVFLREVMGEKPEEARRKAEIAGAVVATGLVVGGILNGHHHHRGSIDRLFDGSGPFDNIGGGPK